MLEFFKKHNYVVRVMKLSKAACSVAFPEKVTAAPQMEKQNVIYTVKDNNTLSYFSDWYKETHEIDCPVYAARIVIFQDILIKASLWGLSEEFVIYHNEEGDELDKSTSFTDLLDVSMSSENLKLETRLASIFYSAFPDFSSEWETVAKENGVEEGYKLIILKQGDSDE